MPRPILILVSRVFACLYLLASGLLFAAEPKLRDTFSGHKTGPFLGFFSPDGKLLVTRSNTVLL